MRYLAALLLAAMVLAGCSREASNIPPPAPLTLPSAKPLVTQHVTVIGDSYVNQGWADLVQQQLRNADAVKSDMQAASSPGSGYVFRSPGTNQTVLGENAAQLIRPDDALVVFVGSRYDGRPQILPQLANVVHGVFTQAKQTAPQAKLLVIGPIYPEGDPPAQVLQARDIMRDQAAAVGATFVDPIAEGWLVDQPEAISTGNVTEAGNVFIAQKMYPLIQKALEVAGARPSAADTPDLLPSPAAGG